MFYSSRNNLCVREEPLPLGKLQREIFPFELKYLPKEIHFDVKQ